MTIQECNWCGMFAELDQAASTAVGEAVCVRCGARATEDEMVGDIVRTPAQFETVLKDVLVGSGFGDADTLELLAAQILSVDTFQEFGMMTRDPGIVVRFANGVELALTIAKTRNSR